MTKMAKTLAKFFKTEFPVFSGTVMLSLRERETSITGSTYYRRSLKDWRFVFNELKYSPFADYQQSKTKAWVYRKQQSGNRRALEDKIRNEVSKEVRERTRRNFLWKCATRQSQSDSTSHRPGFQSGLYESQNFMRAERYATLDRQATSDPKSTALPRMGDITGTSNTAHNYFSAVKESLLR